jgi:hypothetical protein
MTVVRATADLVPHLSSLIHMLHNRYTSKELLYYTYGQ